MFRTKTKKFLHALVVLAGLVLTMPAGARAAVTAEVTPSDIPITLSYHGAPVAVQGKANPGDAVIVKVTSAPGDIHLKYKGKAGGIFWMKLGKLVFKNLPGAYLVASSAALDKTLATAVREAEGLGFDALQKKAEITAEHGNLPSGDWFAQFLDFKTKEKVYAVNEGAVKVDPSGDYRVSLDWPYQAPPGKYMVEVITARSGQVTGRTQAAITVEMTGAVDKLAKLSFDHRAAYGIIAIVVALAAGFAVGNIFKKGGGDGAH